MYQNLDVKTVKISKNRAVISGKTIELYSYEKGFLYNLPPRKRGETDNVVISESRRIDNVICARQNLRRIIDSNKDVWNCVPKFITYTFKENITDVKEANKIWMEYCKKIRYRWGAIKYICVMEFQKRGAIHYHVVYFNLPYIRNGKKVLSKLWGQGFIDFKAVKNIRNLGAYVSKYIQKDLIDLRLRGRKAYFCSRGILRPYQIKNSEEIAVFLENAIVNPELETSYPSPCFGTINYQKGVILNLL